MAEKLKKAGVDEVSIDIIGSNETIKKIYNLNESLYAYEESLKALYLSKIAFTPHVLIGLHYGLLKGEISALKIISKYKPSALILIVFFPIKGTKMEKIQSPKPEDIIEILVQSRIMMPKIPIVLGCARPKKGHRVKTDVLAVETGVNGIAFPSLKAIHKAEELNLEISFSPMCCSQIYKDVKFL
jgi:uncharacterized radical SAM superfamily protein